MCEAIDIKKNLKFLLMSKEGGIQDGEKKRKWVPKWVLNFWQYELFKYMQPHTCMPVEVNWQYQQLPSLEYVYCYLFWGRCNTRAMHMKMIVLNYMQDLSQSYTYMYMCLSVCLSVSWRRYLLTIIPQMSLDSNLLMAKSIAFNKLLFRRWASSRLRSIERPSNYMCTGG